MKTTEIHTRIDLHNILFATDFSQAADASIPYAKQFARRYRAKIYAVHVRQPLVESVMMPDAWLAMDKAKDAEVQKYAAELLKTFPEVPTEAIVAEGDLWLNLSQIIQEKRIDLIVLGTRGRSGLRKLALGSTAEEVFREATCPVLTVGPQVRNWARDDQIKSILFATDFTSESLAAAPYALSLAQEFQSYLNLLHVIELPRIGDLIHAGDLIDSSMRLLHNIVPPETERWCELEFFVECGPVAEKILETAATHGAGLIVLGIRGSTGVPGAATHLPGAIAHQVVSQARCPVLTVRR